MPASAPPVKSPSEKVIPRILPSEPTPPPPPAPAAPPAQPLMHEVRLPAAPIKLQKSESKAASSSQSGSAQAASGKTQIEFLPWSQLSGGQKAGRVGLFALGLAIIFLVVRGITSGLHPGGTVVAPTAQTQPQEQQAAITPSERKDGIQSLCKVFNIYGMPKTVSDATDDAKNAGELFKLEGNETPDRSAYILLSLAKEFQAGQLSQSDCAAAGTPLDSSDANVPFGGTAARAPGQ